MSNIEIESLIKDIDIKIDEVEDLKEMNPQKVISVIQGLKMARKIVEKAL